MNQPLSKKKRPDTVLRSTAVALVLAALPATAFAYLDPSTGSMIVSAIIGIFASVALAVKTYWYKLKNLFRRKDGQSSSSASESSRDS